jgi:glycerophosphoryl diester phosphodiesterase
VNGVDLPRVIGHRGVAAHAPENTLASFAEAARMGVNWIELDVQLSSDGVPVVFHDDRLERTTDGCGRLVDLPVSVLSRLDAGRWFGPQFAGQGIPLFTDVLDLLVEDGLGLCLEVKADEVLGDRTARVALDFLKKRWPKTAPLPLLSSFAVSAMEAMAEVAPKDWPRGWLVEEVPENWQDVVGRLGCRSLHVDHGRLSERMAGRVKEAGLALLAYTVNDRARAERLWGWGVDSVFSDCPDRLFPPG